MKPSELNISFPVKSYDEETAEKYRISYIAEKPIIFQLSKILVPNFDSTNWKLNKDSVKISGPYLLYFLRNKPSKSVAVRPVHRSKRFSQF